MGWEGGGVTIRRCVLMHLHMSGWPRSLPELLCGTGISLECKNCVGLQNGAVPKYVGDFVPLEYNTNAVGKSRVSYSCHELRMPIEEPHGLRGVPQKTPLFLWVVAPNHS